MTVSKLVVSTVHFTILSYVILVDHFHLFIRFDCTRIRNGLVSRFKRLVPFLVSFFKDFIPFAQVTKSKFEGGKLR